MPLDYMEEQEFKYGGFWRRFGALWIDFFCLLPLTAIVFFANDRYRLFTLYYIVPGLTFGLFYSVFLVKYYGGTPGKLAMGLRVRRLDGSRIGYREAFLRYLPEFTLGALASLAVVLATLAISDGEYHELNFMDRSRRLLTLTPVWYKPVHWAQQIWIWGEFIVLLTNRQRRAIHDFIAGTVVIVPSESPPAA